MLAKKIAVSALLVSAGATFFLSGCSDSTTNSTASVSVVRTDEAGLIAAVDSPVVSEIKLDDGRGVSFRASGAGPAFKLEFRQGPQRLNVAWEQFPDTPAAKEINTQNTEWAVKVLTYAIGADSTTKVISTDEPLSFSQAGHKINVTPSEVQTLVTISPL